MIADLLSDEEAVVLMLGRQFGAGSAPRSRGAGCTSSDHHFAKLGRGQDLSREQQDPDRHHHRKSKTDCGHRREVIPILGCD